MSRHDRLWNNIKPMQPHFNTQPLARWRDSIITKWRVSKWLSWLYNSCDDTHSCDSFIFIKIYPIHGTFSDPLKVVDVFARITTGYAFGGSLRNKPLSEWWLCEVLQVNTIWSLEFCFVLETVYCQDKIVRIDSGKNVSFTNLSFTLSLLTPLLKSQPLVLSVTCHIFR